MVSVDSKVRLEFLHRIARKLHHQGLAITKVIAAELVSFLNVFWFVHSTSKTKLEVPLSDRFVADSCFFAKPHETCHKLRSVMLTAYSRAATRQRSATGVSLLLGKNIRCAH
jgi:hypothetical protein